MEDTEQKVSQLHLVPAAIVFAGLLIAGAIVYSNFRGTPAGEIAAIQDTEEKIINSGDLLGDDPTLGNPEAPVTIVEFADFQCPFCGRFYNTAGKEIIEKYVKTGKAKFVYRDFAFLGPESEWAGMASECADEQGKFWQYHDYLYTNHNGENEGAFSKGNLKKFAKELGLNQEQFNQCLDSEKYLTEVREDTAYGRDVAGVSGTPTVFINGRPTVGAVSFAELDKVIQEELSKK